MNKLKLVATIGLSFALVGCFESRKNTEQLCADNPALRCEQLNMDDGQCRVARTDLVWHRFEVLKAPTDQNKIEEYHILAEYEKCLSLAAQIQPIDQNSRKDKRFTALMHSGEEKTRLVQELKRSTSPQALYFLWSQEGDEQAQRLFLRMEGSPALETSEMQYALATFYTSRDQEKTIHLLHRALELSDGKKVNTDILKSLASINFSLNRKEQAYIWAQVASSFDVAIASANGRQLMYGFVQEKYDQLDDVASEVEDAIEDGAFRASMLANFQ